MDERITAEMAVEICKRNGVKAEWGTFGLFPMATAFRQMETRIAELESLIKRMDEMANNDGYCEFLSATVQ